jgi:hypothetical protein
MIKRSVITTLLILASFIAFAQDKTGSIIKADSTIIRIPTEIVGHTRYDYTIAGKKQTTEEVEARLYAYAPSKVEVLKSSRETSLYGLSFIGFGISGVGATLEYIDGSGPHHNLNGAYVLTGVATAFVISAILHGVSAKHHAHKALVLYNQRYQ